jgi:HpcH/HpaI aldolase/citrate lyase family
MIDLLTITNSLEQAAQCDRLPGMRVFVDLERKGKAERQAGRNTFISTHQIEDIGRVKAVLQHARLMVRVNPHDSADPDATRTEVNAVIAQGADLIMLPMFGSADQLRQFAAIVDGRVPIVALLETAGALASIDEWVDMPGLHEVFVGLNDLHISLGCRFMFEPLVQGHVERVGRLAKQAGKRFGFGGIARMEEGLLPGRDVLAEHVRLGSQAVILSRTFNRQIGLADGDTSFEEAVSHLRNAESALLRRTPEQASLDSARVAALINQVLLAAKQTP